LPSFAFSTKTVKKGQRLAICVQKESKEEEVNIIYQSVFQNVLQLEDYFSASGRFIGDSFVVAEYFTSD